MEDLEDLRRMFLLEADAIVHHFDHMIAPRLAFRQVGDRLLRTVEYPATDRDLGHGSGIVVFQGIAQEVLKKLPELRFITRDLR